MDDSASRGVFDGSYTLIGSELVPVAEPTDITGVTNQGTGQDGTDTVEVRQRRARRPNCVLDPLVGHLQLSVESHIVEQLVGQVISDLLHRSHWIEVIDQPHGVRSVELLGGSPR